MPRLAVLLLLAAPLIAACDSAEPGDDLIGTWTLTSVSSDLRVTSQTAQSIPDLTADPSGAVTVGGAVSARLDHLQDIYAFDGYANAHITSEDLDDRNGPIAELFIYQNSDPTQLFADAQFYDEATGENFSGYYQGRTAFSFAGGVLQVSALSLNGGGDPVTIGGSLTFPTVSLVAGQPTSAPQRSYDDFGDEVSTFRFDRDGTFVVTVIDGNRAEAQTGTWEILSDGRVRIGVIEGSRTEFVTFGYRVQGESLVLEAAGLDGLSECDANCLRSIESSLFAQPNSLTAAEFVTELRFREGDAQASARTAPALSQAPDQSQAPLGRRFAPTVPILGR